MGCSSGTSSGQFDHQSVGNYSEDQDIQQIRVMDTRKRKRMISNRESARRSRIRKQKHIDDLITLVNQLRDDNNQILTEANVTTQLYLNIEAENSILRAQISELTHRLHSLNDIIFNCCALNDPTTTYNVSSLLETPGHDDFLNPGWNLLYLNQPITCMASPDVLMY